MATGKGNQSVEEVKAACASIEISPSKSSSSSSVYGKGRTGGGDSGGFKGGSKK